MQVFEKEMLPGVGSPLSRAILFLKIMLERIEIDSYFESFSFDQS